MDLHFLSCWPDWCRFITLYVLDVFVDEWDMYVCWSLCNIIYCSYLLCAEQLLSRTALTCHRRKGFSPIRDKHEKHLVYKEHALHLKLDTGWEPVKKNQTMYWRHHTVDGWNLANQLIGSLSHCFWGFTHPRWCRISAINSMYYLVNLVTVKHVDLNMHAQTMSVNSTGDPWKIHNLPLEIFQCGVYRKS